MVNPFRNLFPKKIIGVDIGTFAIKVVEVSKWGKSKKLENYGQVKSTFVPKELLSDPKVSSAVIPSELASVAVKAILNEAKIKTKDVVFSIPDFFTFCTSFDLPPMPEKEIPKAIAYNASQYITLPISEVTLDWRIISNAETDSLHPLKVFVVAIPNQVVQEYQKIVKGAGLNLIALEAEVFGITKGLIKDNKKTVCLVDIGIQSTTLNIIDRGLLKRSYSFSFDSLQLSQAFYSMAGFGYNETAAIKDFQGKGVAKTLFSLTDTLLTEVKNISNEFMQQEEREVEEIYLTGGTANLPGLKDYFSKSLNKNVSLPNCFSDLSCPAVLSDVLAEMSPSFSAALGVALDGLDI